MVAMEKSRARLHPEQQPSELALPEIVRRLEKKLGSKLLAYITAQRSARSIDDWVSGVAPEGDVETRLRFAYRIATALEATQDHSVIQLWFTGLSPVLEDRSPATMLREGMTEDSGRLILNAAHFFITGS